MNARASVFLALLVLLAGCGGAVSDANQSAEGTVSPSAPTASPVGATEPTEAPSPEPTPTPEPTPEPTPTATPEPQVDPDNPFGTRTLVVVVNHSADDRNLTPVVERSLRYWEENAEEYAGYPVEFKLVSYHADPDISVTFVEGGVACGVHEDPYALGCAPLNAGRAAPTSEVAVRANMTEHTTHAVLVHELGHTLGLGHNDEPQEYMGAERPLGLANANAAVYYEWDDGYRREQMTEQVENAFLYFERGAHGTLGEDERPNYTFVDSREEADIVVVVTSDEEQCGRFVNCVRPGPRYDQDTLLVAGADGDLVGYYLAYSLAWRFYDSPYEFPDALSRDATYEEASSDWWKDSNA